MRLTDCELKQPKACSMEKKARTERLLTGPGLHFICARLDKGKHGIYVQEYSDQESVLAYGIGVDPPHITLVIYGNDMVGNEEQKRSGRVEILMFYDTVFLYRGLYAPRRRC